MSRKPYTIHYIYKTTCIPTEKFYIGMHSTFDMEDGYLGSGRRLKYSISKYGKEKHKKEILEFCKDGIELKCREKEIVNEDFIKDEMCMNLMVGGKGGFISVEQQRRRSIAGAKAVILKRKNNPVEFKKFSDRSSKIMKQNHTLGKIKYDTFTGKSHSEETKKKIGLKNSINQKGNKNSAYGKCWIYNIKLEKNKLIKKDKLKNYIIKGWIKGRKMSF